MSSLSQSNPSENYSITPQVQALTGNPAEFMKQGTETRLSLAASEFMNNQVNKLLDRAGVRFLGIGTRSNDLDKL